MPIPLYLLPHLTFIMAHPSALRMGYQPTPYTSCAPTPSHGHPHPPRPPPPWFSPTIIFGPLLPAPYLPVTPAAPAHPPLPAGPWRGSDIILPRPGGRGFSIIYTHYLWGGKWLLGGGGYLYIFGSYIMILP